MKARGGKRSSFRAQRACSSLNAHRRGRELVHLEPEYREVAEPSPAPDMTHAAEQLAADPEWQEFVQSELRAHVRNPF